MHLGRQVKNAQLDWIKGPYGKTPQSTDCIARIFINVLICRTFMRSVFTGNITRVGGSIARSHR
jgi:hypothetical protein